MYLAGTSYDPTRTLPAPLYCNNTHTNTVAYSGVLAGAFTKTPGTTTAAPLHADDLEQSPVLQHPIAPHCAALCEASSLAHVDQPHVDQQQCDNVDRDVDRHVDHSVNYNSKDSMTLSCPSSSSSLLEDAFPLLVFTQGVCACCPTCLFTTRSSIPPPHAHLTEERQRLLYRRCMACAKVAEALAANAQRPDPPTLATRYVLNIDCVCHGDVHHKFPCSKRHPAKHHSPPTYTALSLGLS